MPRAIVARPHSSLSAGVVSDCSTATWREETTLREGDVTLEEGGSIHSCDTEGYYTTFHDFDGLQEVIADVHLVIHEDGEEGQGMDEKEFEMDTTESSRVSLEYSNSEVVLRKRKGGKVPPPPQRLSSLGRESTGTVVAREDLAKEEAKEDAKDLTSEEIKDLDKEEEEKEIQRKMELRELREVSVVSNDVSFDSEERQERISAKTLMAAEHIPSLCNITPSPSGQNTPVNSSPVPSR